MGVHPVVIGVTNGQALELNAGVLLLGQVVGDLASLFDLVAFQQGVEQRRAVIDPIAGIGVGGGEYLAVQRLGLFRLALFQVRAGNPTQRVGRQLHAFASEGLVIADHLGMPCSRFERAQAVNAPADDVVLGCGVRRPATDQFVVVLQGTVCDDVAFLLAACGELSHAHTLGGKVTFEAALGDCVHQPRALGREAQCRLRQPRLLQGNDVFTRHFGFIARPDKGLVEFEQRVVVQAGTCQRISQGHAAIGVIGLRRHQRAQALYRFVGFAAIGLGEGLAQLQVDVIGFTQQRLAIDRFGLSPLLLIAISARHRGECLGGEVAMLALRLVNLEHFSILPGPAGDHQVVADLAWGLAFGGELAKLGQRRREVTVAGLNDQGIVGGVGKRKAWDQQLAAQCGSDKQTQPA